MKKEPSLGNVLLSLLLTLMSLTCGVIYMTRDDQPPTKTEWLIGFVLFSVFGIDNQQRRKED